MQAQQQKITAFTATLIGINAMIGAGIFTAPIKLASYVGPAGILTYIFIIIAVWCMAFSFARLAQLMPQEGSFYTYTRSWAGHGIGLLCGASYIIGILVAMGLLTQLVGHYAHAYAPTYSAHMLGIIILAALVILNALGGTARAVTNYISIICTSVPLALITIMCFTKARLANLTPFAPYGFGNVLRATSAVIFGFFGFESTMSLTSMVENPERTVPRALSTAIIFVSIVYLAFISSIILAVPASTLTDPTMPLSKPLIALFPNYPWLIGLIHFTILASFISVINAMVWATSSMICSLAKNITALQHVPLARSHRFVVIVAGIFIAISAYVLTNIDLFFNITAVCVVFAYSGALVALLYQWHLLTTAERIRALGGIVTALLIMYCAIDGLI